MKVNTKSRYALRCMCDLALSKDFVSVNDISLNQTLTNKYIESIFASLKKQHLVLSKKGANGGYQLARSASKIKVYDIFSALELSESIAPKTTADDDLTQFIKENVWDILDESINKSLNKITLKSLISKEQIK